MNRKCIGCGATLQCTDENKVGYVPKDKLDSAKYCMRCFKINNYNLKTITNLENINSYILEEINKKAKYVYFMLDFLNINSETINTYKLIKVPKCLIISKLDIIPKSIKCNHITEYLKSYYNIQDRIIYQSSKKELHTSEIVNNIINNSLKNVYLVGYTNSGKSSLINTLIENNKLTTSNNLNTTIDFIKIDIGNGYLIDSPGFIYKKSFYNSDEFDLIKRANPRTFLKPRTYQTKENLNLVVENKLSIKTDNINSLTFYVSNEIVIDKVFDNETKKLLNKPEIELKVDANSDLIIKSIGFVNIKKACLLKIRVEDEELIEIRPSLFQ
ncbi:MAG: 50S ribosome-binding GTPase [Bacilli bacterium]|nr:50S ribosome-binding GTPase [Bacilli bacterium]